MPWLQGRQSSGRSEHWVFKAFHSKKLSWQLHFNKWLSFLNKKRLYILNLAATSSLLTPPEDCLAFANAHAFYQAHLSAQNFHSGEQGAALTNLINQETADRRPPPLYPSGASSPPVEEHPVLSQPLALQVNANNLKIFYKHTFKILKPGDRKHQARPIKIEQKAYTTNQKLFLFLEPQTPLLLLFQQQVPPPQIMFFQSAIQIWTPNKKVWNPLLIMLLPPEPSFPT